MQVPLRANSQLSLSGLIVLGNVKQVPPGITKHLVDLRTFDEVADLPQLVNELGRASATVTNRMM